MSIRSLKAVSATRFVLLRWPKRTAAARPQGGGLALRRRRPPALRAGGHGVFDCFRYPNILTSDIVILTRRFLLTTHTHSWVAREFRVPFHFSLYNTTILLWLTLLIYCTSLHSHSYMIWCWPPMTSMCHWSQLRIGLGVGPKSYLLTDRCHLTLPLLIFTRYLSHFTYHYQPLL